MEFSTNRLLNVWETLLSFSKYFLSLTFSQNIKYCSVAFFTFVQYILKNRYLQISSFKICGVSQGWKNPLVRSPWRVPYAVGRVEILTVSNVKY